MKKMQKDKKVGKEKKTKKKTQSRILCIIMLENT